MEQQDTACNIPTPGFRKKGNRNVEHLSDLDHVVTNARSVSDRLKFSKEDPRVSCLKAFGAFF